MKSIPDILISRPSFAEVRRAVEEADLAHPRKLALRRDIDAFCGWLDRAPESVPADLYWLRSHIQNLQFGQLGLSRKRFQNVMSNVRAALRLSNIIRPNSKPIEHLSPVWMEVWQKLDGTWLSPALSPLFRFADSQGYTPQQMNDEIFEIYAECKRAASISKDPEKSIRETRTAWNKALGTIPQWPGAKLLGNKRETYNFPLEDFSASFNADIDAYLRDCRAGSVAKPAVGDQRRSYRLRDRSENARKKPLSETYIAGLLEAIRLSASTLVREGEKRIDQINSIKDVISVDALEIVADAILERNETPTEYGFTIGKRFRSIAARWLKPGEEEIEEYNALLAELKEDGVVDGMTEKNMRRLRNFDDPHLFSKLISLPAAVMDEVEALRKKTRTVTPAMALDAQCATGVLILSSLPVRRSTLVRTDADENILWPIGREGEATLSYTPKQETKTHRSLSAKLASWKTELLLTYMRHYQPVLAPIRDNRKLFPGVSGLTHKSVGNLARRMVKFLYDRLGVEMNLHLFRHLMGTKILEENTENTRIVEQLLGQSRNSKSTARYAQIASAAAARHLEKVIERQTAQYAAPSRRRTRPQ